MNKLIVIAALALAGSPALASKARVSALNNSRQLVDVQYTFERPYLLTSVGELATIEWGATGDAAARHAEGGFIKKSGDSVYGLYFGRKSAEFSGAVTAFNAVAPNDVLAEQNPISLLYASKMGDLTWGATLKYSNGSNEAANDQKSSSAGISAGVTNGTWEAELVLGLVGKSEATNSTLESKGNTKIGFGYNLSDMMHVYADYRMVKFDATVGATSDTTEVTTMNVGFINTLVKNDDANFFYGVAYSSNSIKDDEEKSTLPVWMGIEANATSWMVMRASLQQSVLINTTNDKTASPNAKSNLDSIAFNAGAGLKLGKGMLDVNIASAGNFDYAAAGFLTNASYTYNF